MKIVIIGGTGLIGSKVVEKLEQRGHDATPAAPSTGVDTLTGKGLAEALAGAEVVVDVSNAPVVEDQAAMDFFQTSGRNLIAAETNAGVRHHVLLSIVGIEGLRGRGYFHAKLAQQELIKGSAIPHTVVQATQFFEFLRAIAASATQGETVRLAPIQFQPLAAEDVANALVDAALAEPANGTVEVAGPDRFTLDEAVGKVLQHDQDPRNIVADPQAPYFGVPVTERSLVPGPDARLGSIKLDWWLTHAPPPPNTAPPSAAEPVHG
jgi:uncharacterized protein YbjT (DUF2867 family)